MNKTVTYLGVYTDILPVATPLPVRLDIIPQMLSTELDRRYTHTARDVTCQLLKTVYSTVLWYDAKVEQEVANFSSQWRYSC